MSVQALGEDKPTEEPRQLNAANRYRLTPAIQQVVATYHLEPALLHAVISVESGYNPRARSPKGAQGLMQLMPGTAARFAVADPYDPIVNLQGGTRYLRWLLDLFTDLRLALAAYNAGEGAVQRYGKAIPPHPETGPTSAGYSIITAIGARRGCNCVARQADQEEATGREIRSN